jgi:serine/threonine-protein kinase HipA
VAGWFENLLPESRAIRDRLRARFGGASDGAFDLLAAIGRDCVGAVQIVPADTDPGDVRRIEATAIGEEAVARLLRSVTASGPLGVHDDEDDDFRFSLAGAQEKTALLRMNGKWYRPHGATPTTHILKLPLGVVGNMRADMHDSVENEWLCMHFLAELGLPVAETELTTFRDDVSVERVLVVTRFDRAWTKVSSSSKRKWIARLPQEDFCQASAGPAARKYETDGGPGIRKSLELIRGGTSYEADARVFVLAQLAFWLLAATDGHAKNFAVFLRRDGYAMTPLYDVLSAWPMIGHGPNLLPLQRATLAMALRGTRATRRHLDEISVRHWQSLALQSGVPGLFEEMVDLVERSESALGAVRQRLPEGFPRRVRDAIAKGVRYHRRRFLEIRGSTPSFA